MSVTFAASRPNEESVTLLLREAADLTGHRIEYRALPAAGAEPAWAPYYTFEQEARLPAGTRMRVYAGSATGPPSPPAEPGLVQRFIAAAGAAGQIRLPVGGAALRLVGRGGIVGHARRFLPPGSYTAVSDARVLRRADGTGFFIMRVPAGPATISPLAPGQYCLVLLYRRDNRAIDPASHVLRQANSSSSEQVTLDIPW